MAAPHLTRTHRCNCRFASPTFNRLTQLLFSRYPADEWASFIRLGWRETTNGLVLTLEGLDEPRPGELDDSVAHVAFQEPYTVRIALLSEQHEFAVGVIHSHPRGCLPSPSYIDDDMDEYYASYFEGFTGGRPYVSLIASLMDGERLVMSGRVYWRGRWLPVERFCSDGQPVETFAGIGSRPARKPVPARMKRLQDSFGQEAAERLRASAVAVIGAGGTGSAAIEVLARAGVGRLIIVDPERVEESNLERLHGADSRDGERSNRKVDVALRHIKAIDPLIDVTTCFGSIPQATVIDEVVRADIALGCTDKQHSRLALSELAFRYLLPAVDCGVAVEGANGIVTGQPIQQVLFAPGRPCAVCRKMADPKRIAWELMTDEERRLRIEAAKRAKEQGLDDAGYGVGLNQINTVGYLTTMAGAMAAGYAIGVITGRFGGALDRAQFNLFQETPDAVGWVDRANPDCPCQRLKGHADQSRADLLITAPGHWPPPKIDHH